MDFYTLQITWKDGTGRAYRYSTLQQLEAREKQLKDNKRVHTLTVRHNGRFIRHRTRKETI